MADKKITQATDLGNALASVDLFHVVDDPSGTPINKKVSAGSIFNNIPTWLGLKQSSQSIATDGSSIVADADLNTAITEINATTQAGTISLQNGADGQIKMFLNTSTSGSFAKHNNTIKFKRTYKCRFIWCSKTATLMFKSGSWNILANTGTTGLITIGVYNVYYNNR